MAILEKGTDYTSGDAVTALNLNSLVDSATFKDGSQEATDVSTLEVHSAGYLQIKDDGVTSAKLAPGAVTASEIAAGTITSTQLEDNAVTSDKISDTDGQFLVDDTSTQKLVVINEAGADVDFRVEGDTDTSLLVTDGANDVVGIGSSNVAYKLNVDGGTAASIANFTSNVAGGNVALFVSNSSTTGTSAIVKLVAQTGGTSYSKSLNIDLSSANNNLQLTHADGDEIGVKVQNSNGGSGSETGSFYPNFDNKTSCGIAGARWSVIYAGSATILTSDRNEKEEIEDLSEAELRVAKAIKGLVKKFKFKGRVRTHVGVIAQDVQDAFTAEGLDASEYGLFCSDTWTDEDTGEEKTRLGIRYEELLAFVIAAL
jgi:hypothetical protein